MNLEMLKETQRMCPLSWQSWSYWYPRIGTPGLVPLERKSLLTRPNEEILDHFGTNPGLPFLTNPGIGYYYAGTYIQIVKLLLCRRQAL